MAGKLLNNTLSSLSGGVTEQYQEGRYDSQVQEMVNCIPSITRGVIRRNPLVGIDKLTAPGLPTDISTAYMYSYDRGTGDEQYLIVIPGNGYSYVFNANDGTHLYTNPTSDPYLVAPIGSEPKQVFMAITIGDHTFICNNTITTGYDTSIKATTSGYSDMAFYWIKKTTAVTAEQYQDSTTVGILSLGYEYTLNNLLVRGSKDTRPGVTDPDLDTANKIAEKFAADPTNSKVDAVDKSVAYKTSFAETDFSWGDTFGDEASLGVWKTVDDADKLPVNLPIALNGFIVQVSGGTSEEHDDYYLQYTYETKRWSEIAEPGVYTTLDANTMPHVLYRLSGGFELNTYQTVLEDGSGLIGDSAWGVRTAGGGGDLDDPSFIGKAITSIFFHKNRLGLLVADSIVLSITSDYGNFFFQTVQNILDDDPIDLAIASTDVNILRHAVSTSGTLILFSDITQYSLTAVNNGPLTPESSTLVALSNYTYSNAAPAVAISNKVYFTNTVGNYSQMYIYKVTNLDAGQTEAMPMTTHLPTYIDNNLEYIVGHDVLGFTFVKERDNPTELVVLNVVTKGQEDLQNAFHRWKFSKDISSIHIIKNYLYIVFSDGDFGYISLEVPGSIEDVTYHDVYKEPGVVSIELYPSFLEFSEFFVRDSAGKGTVRGRYQLRTIQYTVEDYSSYQTVVGSLTHSLFNTDTMMGTDWDDTLVWDDTLIWVEVDPLYERIYKNDDKVTIMGDSKHTKIRFEDNPDTPTKGFELATVNVEGFMYQRSTRR